MAKLSDVLVLAATITAVLAVDFKTKADEEPVYQSAQVKVGDHGIQASSQSTGGGAVSSIASVASRNGRLSSYSGVYSPGLGAPIMITSGDNKEFFYPSTKTTDGKSSPLSITKEFNDKYSSGTVKISPGSVSVSSVAKSGSSQPFDSLKNPMPAFPVDPFNYDPFLQHRVAMFQPRYNPWFSNDMFKSSVPSQSNNLRPTWLYPSFNPFFNYWR